MTKELNNSTKAFIKQVEEKLGVTYIIPDSNTDNKDIHGSHILQHGFNFISQDDEIFETLVNDTTVNTYLFHPLRLNLFIQFKEMYKKAIRIAANSDSAVALLGGRTLLKSIGQGFTDEEFTELVNLNVFFAKTAWERDNANPDRFLNQENIIGFLSDPTNIKLLNTEGYNLTKLPLEVREQIASSLTFGDGNPTIVLNGNTLDWKPWILLTNPNISDIQREQLIESIHTFLDFPELPEDESGKIPYKIPFGILEVLPNELIEKVIVDAIDRKYAPYVEYLVYNKLSLDTRQRLYLADICAGWYQEGFDDKVITFEAYIDCFSSVGYARAANKTNEWFKEYLLHVGKTQNSPINSIAGPIVEAINTPGLSIEFAEYLLSTNTVKNNAFYLTQDTPLRLATEIKEFAEYYDTFELQNLRERITNLTPTESVTREGGDALPLSWLEAILDDMTVNNIREIDKFMKS